MPASRFGAGETWWRCHFADCARYVGKTDEHLRWVEWYGCSHYPETPAFDELGELADRGWLVGYEQAALFRHP